MTELNTTDAPRPAGHYAQGVRVGELIFVAGQVPRDQDGTYTPASVGTETHAALRNLAAVLEAGGANLSQVVKVTAYLGHADYWTEFDRAYALFFGASRPARTTVVAGLRDVKVEIDAIACLPKTT